jgi:hypothetical protein
VTDDGWVCCTFPSTVTIFIPVELCDDQGGSYLDTSACPSDG